MNIEIIKGIPIDKKPSEIEILKQENESLLKRVEESENAIMMLMEMNMSLL
jgi:hypothetical protein